jgi:Patatin-like phospholipase
MPKAASLELVATVVALMTMVKEDGVMAKKLAITIAGAVSLGSYESGVAFELLDAINQHNQWADANSQPGERIEIDVLTGASAGGMTAAIIAQRLLYDGPSMSQPYDNPLYNAWVSSVDIAGLLARGPKEDVTHSVLSSDFVIRISDTYLMGRYSSPQPPLPPQPHPALPSDRKLQLGLALSNLNGVDYYRSTLSGGQFIYTRHEDQLVRALDQASDDREQAWDTIREAAVACGAFPAAFRVQDLIRNIVEYTSQWLDKAVWGGQPSTTFTYTDGGVFQNEPLGMAKNLVEQIPGGRLSADQRGYLFIAPKQKSSTAVKNSPNPALGFDAATANYKILASRLADSVVGQSEFQDWSVAEGYNDQLLLLNERADELQKLFFNGTLTPTITLPVSNVLLKSFFAVDGQTTQASVANLDAARAQLQQQYASEYAQLRGPAGVADAWLDTVLLLELAARLHEKEEMLIYDFVAQPKLLASSGLMAFAGFFDVSYRKHDYDYGRSVVQKQLPIYQKQPNSVFSNLHWTPRPIDPINQNLNNIQMAQVDKTKRQKVYDQISDAANDLLKELDVNLAIRKALMWFYVEGQVKKLLAL